MLGSAKNIILTFHGWHDPLERDHYHNSPEYFENVWAGDGIADKPSHPPGLINLYEERQGDHVTRLRVLIDPDYLTVEELLRLLQDIGLRVELEQSN